MNVIRWAAIAAVLCVLSACSSKPPGCADEEVVSLFRSMILEDETSSGKELRAADAKGIVRDYLDRAKVTLNNVVSEGYAAESKRQSCKATVRVEFSDDKGWEKEIPYSTQLTVDGKGKFVLEAEGLAALTLLSRKAVSEHYLETRWGGTWAGTYACSGVNGEASGPRGPFSMPVELVVEGYRAKLERLTAGGGVEKLDGGSPDINGAFTLEGRGRNAGDDQWQTRFVGRADGDLLVAEGTIGPVSFDAKPLRSCTLRLSKGAGGAEAKATEVALPATGSASGWPGTYAGEGDSDVTLEVKQQGTDEKYPVLLSTNTARTGGGCGGSVSGFATASGNELRIVAEAEGQRCEAVAKRSGNGIELEEGAGCNNFHGAACGFSAQLKKLQ